MTLDTVCVSLRKEGVGTEVKHATVMMRMLCGRRIF